ncbi:FkbM family methyltransferase [Cohnella sp. SGD-V74]|uniref:FkbM family methyltransferase n=1 Tax=unclassified Cohnella TaxID=2636738 RepID=UPI000D4B0E73|nr:MULTISPECIES: FkbM family methyltransferase [unclassified Cohnella]PRX67068.1 FkbM family methyltransferase [Cohnella sp. SGD-V74]
MDIKLKTVVHRIYNHLADKQSQDIFQSRMMYSLTNDYRFIMDVVNMLPQSQQLNTLISTIPDISSELIMYGAGSEFNRIICAFPQIKFKCLCDKNPEKQKIGWHGYDVISPQELFENYKDSYVMIVSSKYWREIYEELTSGGVPEGQIINVGKISAELLDLQYFDTDIVRPALNEIFIDAGCFDCETDLSFRKWCDGAYEKIYAFEPDIQNYKKCQVIIERKRIENIYLFPNGLWEEKKTLNFSMQQSQRSKVINKGNERIVTIEGVPLDEIVGEDKVTFIKMDVEGSELEALRGARNTIRQNRPKLAISIYHRDNDIFEIPDYVLSLHSDYRLYIRHYSLGPEETVLYAI